MFITRSAVLNSLRRSDFARPSAVDDFALTTAERALFEALNRRGVPFLLIGIGAAALERVIASKRALRRAKDAAQLPALEATLLARRDPNNT